MTKGELLRFLEPFTDELEILVDLGQDHNNLTKVGVIVNANYHSHLGTGEVWLELDLVSLTRKTR